MLFINVWPTPVTFTYCYHVTFNNNNYYPRKRGYVIGRVCVCMYVCVNRMTQKKSWMKFEEITMFGFTLTKNADG